jgi:hypothetical protein
VHNHFKEYLPWLSYADLSQAFCFSVSLFQLLPPQ